MDARMQARRKLELDLREALGKGAFELLLPAASSTCERDEITGFEALLRWNHPERGLIAAGRVHPAGRGDRPDRADRRMGAAPGLRARRRSWPRARQGRGQPLGRCSSAPATWCELVVDALAASGLAAGRLELEITEIRAAAEHRRRRWPRCTSCARSACASRIDDFGTGYSSLSYLRSFPFDKIKIDQSFVAGTGGASDHAVAIIEAVAGLGAQLDIATTAEGVETDDQLAAVRAWGYGGARFLHRPAPPLRRDRRLARRRERKAGGRLTDAHLRAGNVPADYRADHISPVRFAGNAAVTGWITDFDYRIRLPR